MSGNKISGVPKDGLNMAGGGLRSLSGAPAGVVPTDLDMFELVARREWDGDSFMVERKN